DGERGADAELHAHFDRHVEDAEYLVEHRNDDRAAADPKQAGENPGDEAANNDHADEPSELAGANSEDHAPSLRAACSGTSSSARANRSAPASDRTACVASMRRNARAPGTA